MRNELRQPSADMLTLEDVREDAPQPPPRALTRVYRDGATPEIDRANVVEAEDVVCVAMRNQQRVEPVDLFAQRLLAKISRDIDHHATPVIFYHQAGAQTLVARIVRPANFTIAPDHRHADRRPCSEESDSHKEWVVDSG